MNVRRAGGRVAVLGWVGGGIAAAALVVGAYLLGAQDRAPDSSRSPDASPAAPLPAAPVEVRPAANPERTAVAWLVGYRTLSWSDPSPSAWIARVAPVLTPRMIEEYRGYADGSGGATWAAFVEQRCVSRVTRPVATISGEAPRGAHELYIDIQGFVNTSCTTGEPPGEADEQVSATLQLRLGDDRLWRVDRRVY